MIQVAAFDLDGTLSQSEYFLLPAYKDALGKMQITPPHDNALKNMIGGTVEDNLEIAMPGRTMEDFKVFLDYVQAAVERYLPNGRLYPGVAQSLATLKKSGVKIAMCSNGVQSYVEAVLGALGILGEFDLILYNEPGGDKAALLGRILRALDADRAVMVGDRHFDQTAAKANGVPFIGCAYGLYPEEIAQADIVIQSASEIAQAVAHLLG